MKNENIKKQFISIPEAARRYPIGRDKLYELVKKNNSEVPFIKINSVYKINVPLFEDWLDKISKEGKQL